MPETDAIPVILHQKSGIDLISDNGFFYSIMQREENSSTKNKLQLKVTWMINCLFTSFSVIESDL